jgi:hypothetical protein
MHIIHMRFSGQVNDHTAKRDIKSMLAQLQALSKGGELS